MTNKTEEKTKLQIAFRRWYIPGAFLGLMFYIWVGLVMPTLSAHQLRYKVQQASTADNALTMSTVRQLYKSIIVEEKDAQRKYDTQIKILSERRENVDQRIEKLTTELEKAQIK